MIDALTDDLKSDEGWRASVYKDHLGYLTIGYGFLVDDRRKGELPKHIAEEWLMYAVTQRYGELVRRHPWINEQPDDVRRALGNMAYQMGVDGVSKFKQMLASLKDGDRKWAAIHALDSRWATQTPQRAKRVTDLLRGSK